MDQKTLLAIVLSIGIIIGWSWLFPPPPPKKKPIADNTTIQKEETSSLESKKEELVAIPVQTDLPAVQGESALAKDIVVETDYYRAVIDTRGGVLKSLLLKNYQHFKSGISLGRWIPFLESMLGKTTPEFRTEDNLVQMIKADFVNKVNTLGVRFDENPSLSKLFFQAIYSSDQDHIQIDSGTSPQTLVLRSPVRDGVEIIKTLQFYASDYSIDYEVSLVNRGDAIHPLKVQHVFGEGRVKEPLRGQGRAHIGPVYVYNGELETVDTDDLELEPGRISQMEWLGLEDSFFISAAAGLSQTNRGFFEVYPYEGKEGRELKPIFGMSLPPVDLNPGKQIKSSFKLYYGPKVEKEMMKFGHNLFLSHDLTLEILAKPLLDILAWIYSYVGNYGVSIIFLTILVRAVLFPLTYKGSKSMKRMQQLQPKMLKLREKYKDKKEKLNQEMMGLYKRHKVNPMGGCFPMLLQLPIFFALYSALSTAVELRHEPFVAWIVDLSAPDGLLVTPILMGISMYMIQKMTPTGMMDPTQAKIMGMLPIVFTFFTFTFPTGLTLYWVTSNIISFGQQFIINRIKLPDLVEES
ncbi:MAG: membrane protein insertase YidC [SAR324 cluster bacterium]|nr:membrane protein insertase YidC [SAR324 cluster bacterium]